MRSSNNDRTRTPALLRASGRTARLLKVLVIGGAVLAAACTGKGKAGPGSASRDGGSAPERGGGVSSW